MNSRPFLREFLEIENELLILISNLYQIQEKRITCKEQSCKPLEQFEGFKLALDASLIRQGEVIISELKTTMLKLKILARKASENVSTMNKNSIESETEAFFLESEHLRKAQLIETVEGLGQIQDLQFFASLQQVFPVEKGFLLV
jgi:hypothetical protein